MTERRVACVVLTFVWAFANTALAQDTSEHDRADKFFNEASALIDRGNYTEACPKLEESQKLDPALGTQFNLALCHVKIGRLASAWRHFGAVVKLAHETGKAAREQAARDQMADIRPHVAHFVFSARAADVTIKVDGDVVPREAWTFYPVDAGDHTIDVTASAKKPWQTHVTTLENHSSTPGVELPIAVPELATAAGATVVITKETSKTRRTLGFIVGGVGVAGVAAAIVTGVLVLDAKSDASANCTPTCVNQTGRDAVNFGTTLLPINAVAWGVGIVGLGVGSVLVLLKGKQPSTTVSFAPAAGGFAMGVSGRF